MRALRGGYGFFFLGLLVLVGCRGPVMAVTRYVDIHSSAPTAPFLSPVHAATNIQDAVDVAVGGDTVLVADGIYRTGGRKRPGGGISTLNNRVMVPTNITLRSMNGALFTSIVGGSSSGGGLGVDATRCLYLAGGARCTGFLLTNGYTRATGASGENSGGGAYIVEGTLSACTVSGNHAKFGGGGIYGGAISNCIIRGNSADSGGGSSEGSATLCTFSHNTAFGIGGGSFGSTLTSCTVSNNTAQRGGGGAAGCTVLSSLVTHNQTPDTGGGLSFNSTATNCVIAFNTAHVGGGSFGSSLDRCIIQANMATDDGGGVHQGTLSNCLVFDNRTDGLGGGLFGGTAHNCTIVDNWAAERGGGMYRTEVRNSIIYHNEVEVSWEEDEYFIDAVGDLSYSCTTPDPGTGPSNITGPPAFVNRTENNYLLLPASPGVDAGNNALAVGDQDLRGADRVYNGTVDMGAYEISGQAARMELSTQLLTASTPEGSSAVQSFDVRNIGAGTMNYVVSTNAAWISVEPARGDCAGETDTLAVTLNASSLAVGIHNGQIEVTAAEADNAPQVVDVEFTVLESIVVPTTHYVNLLNTTPVYPYASWATAADNIQDATDAALDGSTVWVADGVYDTGSRLSPITDTELACRLVVTNALDIRSLNGSAFTHIVGAAAPGGGVGNGAIRCVYLATNASLSGFTIRDGHTRGPKGISFLLKDYDFIGGAIISDEYAMDRVGMHASGGVVSNCVFTGNTADREGGGTWGVKSYNCLFVGNTARMGGGAAFGSVVNCTVADNVATASGGGTHGTHLMNSVIYHNMANGVPNANISNPVGGVRIHEYNCTTVFPLGSHNVITDPLFYDRPLGNYRLAPDSPCVSAGLNDYAPWMYDLAGGPRIRGGTVDIGAYERGPVETWISVSVTRLDPTANEGFSPPNNTFTVTNLGLSNMTYQVSADVPWMDLGPAGGMSTGEADTITVEYDAATLPNGVYTGAITVASAQTPESRRVIPVILTLNQGVFYVDVDNPTPEEPYNNWSNAANTIQDAVDLAPSGTRVIVADGVYAEGGKRYTHYQTTNRVMINKDIVVESVNGAASTTILGAEAIGGGCGTGAVRCVFMRYGTLRGFTLTNGHTFATSHPGTYDDNGGGVGYVYIHPAPVVTDCIITGNNAFGYGGGVSGCTVSNSVIRGNTAQLGGGGVNATAWNCLIAGNSTAGSGGGMYNGYAKNCTIVENSATNSGGGVQGGSLDNSIVYYNQAASGSNWSTGNTFPYRDTCTTPLPEGSAGCFTNSPVFVNRWGGDFRLYFTSPCRDVGNNFRVGGEIDLVGHPRIQNVTVDMGCYEFDPATAPYIPEAWWAVYGEAGSHPILGDLDLDGLNNYGEFLADTHPNDPAIRFPDAVIQPGPLAFTITIVINPSSSNCLYDILWKADLLDSGAWQPYGLDLPGNGGVLPLTVITNPGGGYYRSTVRRP